MVRIIVLLVLLAVVAVVAAWLADNPGTVTLQWQGYRVDTSFGVLVALVALVAALTALAYRVFLFLRRAPGRVIAWRHDRNRARGYRALSAGMVAVAAGDAREAQKQVRRAEVLLHDPPLTMLLSAQAAQLAGDEQAAKRFFEAMLENEEMAFLGTRGLLNQARRRRDKPEALELARQAYRLQPDSEWVTVNLFELQVAAGQWRDAEVTLNAAARAGHFDAQRARRRRLILAYLQGAEALLNGDAAGARDRLRKANGLDPTFVPAAADLAVVLCGDGKDRRARKVIEKAWAANPHPSLKEAWRQANATGSALEGFKAAEALLAKNPGHPESHIAAAEAALDAELWGEARHHLLAAGAENDPPARVCRLLARLEEQENGDQEKARAWLVRGTLADPEPAWCCRSCGHVLAQWQAICSSCESFDSLEWRPPAHVGAIAGGVAPAALLTASTDTDPDADEETKAPAG